MFGIAYVTWSTAAASIGPMSGLNVYGASESSGWGSIEITASPPARSVGNCSEPGAFIRMYGQ